VEGIPSSGLLPSSPPPLSRVYRPPNRASTGRTNSSRKPNTTFLADFPFSRWMAVFLMVRPSGATLSSSKSASWTFFFSSIIFFYPYCAAFPPDFFKELVMKIFSGRTSPCCTNPPQGQSFFWRSMPSSPSHNRLPPLYPFDQRRLPSFRATSLTKELPRAPLRASSERSFPPCLTAI